MQLYALLTARGPLATMSALDVMWVSFYSIGALLVAMLIVLIGRKWITNNIIRFFTNSIAFVLFLIGSVLMFLTITTWPT